MLFVPESMEWERRGDASRAGSTAPQFGGGQVSDNPMQNPTIFPNEIEFGTKHTSSGAFGYLGLRSFDVQDVQAYVGEVVRILGLLPSNGLIIDVRANPGGNILAGEHLLQLFTNKKIEPEPVHIRVTVGAGGLAQSQMFTPWLESINLGVQTAEVFSQGFPLSPTDSVNAVGRKYFGPVVLLTDAACYSTTDFFCAGFQDHQIGIVIGCDGTTGAGGANVWTLELLRQVWPDPVLANNPFKVLPRGMSMRVALRRSVRVKNKAGIPVEDLGTSADIPHRRTKRDMLENEADLYDLAGKTLAQGAMRAE
jgi:C-terminal processing protease CtpA/Prc